MDAFDDLKENEHTHLAYAEFETCQIIDISFSETRLFKYDLIFFHQKAQLKSCFWK